jgi:hypothetical protein
VSAVRTLLWFATGAVTAWTIVSLSGSVHAQGAGAGTIGVCVGSGGVLHVVQPPRSCDPGQKHLTFLLATPANSQSSPPQRQALERTLRDLEQQVANLEQLANRKASSTAKTPFEVQDRRGNVVFSVTSHEDAGTYVRAGQALLDAFDDYGYLNAPSSSGNETLFAGALSGGPDVYGIDMGEQGGTRGLLLGRGVGSTTRDKYKLQVSSTRTLAVVGQSSIGTGIILIRGPEGQSEARMTVPSAGGAVSIVNDKGLPVAVLREGEHGEGLLMITSSGGEPMVDAGENGGGYGLVRAGPGAFRKIPGRLGLPGSYIVGKP